MALPPSRTGHEPIYFKCNTRSHDHATPRRKMTSSCRRQWVTWKGAPTMTARELKVFAALVQVVGSLVAISPHAGSAGPHVVVQRDLAC